MVFLNRREGEEGVDYGYKGQGGMSHLLFESQGRPLTIQATSVKRDERDQVELLLKKLIQKAWRRGKVPVLEADKGYDIKRVRLIAIKKKQFKKAQERNKGFVI